MKEKKIGLIFIPSSKYSGIFNLKKIMEDRLNEGNYCSRVKEETGFSLAIFYRFVKEREDLYLGPVFCLRKDSKEMFLESEVIDKEKKVPTEVLSSVEKGIPGTVEILKHEEVACARIRCGDDKIEQMVNETFGIKICDLSEDCTVSFDCMLVKLLTMSKRKQIILQGPPGTGKTFLAREIAKQLIRKNKGICEQKAKELILEESVGDFRRIKEIIEKEKIESLSELEEYINEKTKQIKKSRDENVEDLVKEKDEAHRFLEKWEEKKKECLSKSVRFVQFHSSYTYEDFVRGIVMTLDEKTKMPQFKAVDKIFAEICKEAEANKDERFVLIIDEINRANLSMVLGELIYALEYRGEEVETPYEVDGSKVLRVPENLFIIGTMNTADRSAGNIDYAIRRRFAFYSVLPDKDKINNLKGRKLYEDIVERIFDKNGNCVTPEFKNSVEDIKVGHTYFMTENENDVEELAYNFVYQVIPLLKEYIKDGILVGEEVDDVFKDVFGKVLSSVNIEDVLDKLKLDDLLNEIEF